MNVQKQVFRKLFGVALLKAIAPCGSKNDHAPVNNTHSATNKTLIYSVPSLPSPQLTTILSCALKINNTKYYKYKSVGSICTHAVEAHQLTTTANAYNS